MTDTKPWVSARQQQLYNKLGNGKNAPTEFGINVEDRDFAKAGYASRPPTSVLTSVESLFYDEAGSTLSIAPGSPNREGTVHLAQVIYAGVRAQNDGGAPHDNQGAIVAAVKTAVAFQDALLGLRTAEADGNAGAIDAALDIYVDAAVAVAAPLMNGYASRATAGHRRRAELESRVADYDARVVTLRGNVTKYAADKALIGMNINPDAAAASKMITALEEEVATAEGALDTATGKAARIKRTKGEGSPEHNAALAAEVAAEEAYNAASGRLSAARSGGPSQTFASAADKADALTRVEQAEKANAKELGEYEGRLTDTRRALTLEFKTGLNGQTGVRATVDARDGASAPGIVAALYAAFDAHYSGEAPTAVAPGAGQGTDLAPVITSLTELTKALAANQGGGLNEEALTKILTAVSPGKLDIGGLELKGNLGTIAAGASGTDPALLALLAEIANRPQVAAGGTDPALLALLAKIADRDNTPAAPGKPVYVVTDKGKKDPVFCREQVYEAMFDMPDMPDPIMDDAEEAIRSGNLGNFEAAVRAYCEKDLNNAIRDDDAWEEFHNLFVAVDYFQKR